MPPSLKETSIISKVHVVPPYRDVFADWQANLNTTITAFAGFVSLEILAPIEIGQQDWTLVERFYSPENLSVWRGSLERQNLFDELQNLLKDSVDKPICEIEPGTTQHENVTEVFVTQVAPNKEEAYRKWIAKIHRVEAKFPGFRGAYVQTPSKGQGRNWITLLQFDTRENLDRWLGSAEREEVLAESKPLIESLESHRVISPYAGWFASLAKVGELPSVWKQTMVVLLVLFPIVMLELKFLSPLVAKLNSSIATFIGNAISVILIACPMMPIAIWCLSWWLSPEPHNKLKATIVGTCLVIVLYLIEIATFWNLL